MVGVEVVQQVTEGRQGSLFVGLRKRGRDGVERGIDGVVQDLPAPDRIEGRRDALGDLPGAWSGVRRAGLVGPVESLGETGRCRVVPILEASGRRCNPGVGREQRGERRVGAAGRGMLEGGDEIWRQNLGVTQHRVGLHGLEVVERELGSGDIEPLVQHVGDPLGADRLVGRS